MKNSNLKLKVVKDYIAKQLQKDSKSIQEDRKEISRLQQETAEMRQRIEELKTEVCRLSFTTESCLCGHVLPLVFRDQLVSIQLKGSKDSYRKIMWLQGHQALTLIGQI